MNQWPGDDMNDYDPCTHGRGSGEPDFAMIIMIVVSFTLFAIVMGIFLYKSEKFGEAHKQQVIIENSNN